MYLHVHIFLFLLRIVLLLDMWKKTCHDKLSSCCFLIHVICILLPFFTYYYFGLASWMSWMCKGKLGLHMICLSTLGRASHFSINSSTRCTVEHHKAFSNLHQGNGLYFWFVIICIFKCLDWAHSRHPTDILRHFI